MLLKDVEIIHYLKDQLIRRDLRDKYLKKAYIEKNRRDIDKVDDRAQWSSIS